MATSSGSSFCLKEKSGGSSGRALLLACLAIGAAAVSIAGLERRTPHTASPALTPVNSPFDLAITLQANETSISALEWRIAIPSGSVIDGSTSRTTKTLQCYGTHCILYGGTDPIPAGVVATIRILRSKPSDAAPLVCLHDVLGVNSDSHPVRVENVNLTISVRR